MILQADLIVYGKIDSLTDHTFYLKNTKFVGCDTVKKELEVIQFKNWTCAARWVKYEKGQEVFLLLQKDQSKWRIMGAGDEGEMPIENDSVNVKWTSLSSGEYLDKADVLVLSSGKLYGKRFDLTTFIYGISLIRKCFNYHNSEPNQICDDASIDQAKKNQGYFVNWLVKKCRGQ